MEQHYRMIYKIHRANGNYGITSTTDSGKCVKSANWELTMSNCASRLICAVICGDTRGGTCGGTGAFNFNLFKSKLLLRACLCGLVGEK